MGMEESIFNADFQTELRLPAPTRHLGDLGFAHTADESPLGCVAVLPHRPPEPQRGLLLTRDTGGGEQLLSGCPARSLVHAAIPLAGVLRGKAHGICDLSLSLGWDRPEP